MDWYLSKKKIYTLGMESGKYLTSALRIWKKNIVRHQVGNFASFQTRKKSAIHSENLEH